VGGGGGEGGGGGGGEGGGVTNACDESYNGNQCHMVSHPKSNLLLRRSLTLHPSLSYPSPTFVRSTLTSTAV